jgi:dTDP-4-dehydrorhamnose reductase
MVTLLTGRTGQLGRALAPRLSEFGPVVAPTRVELDLTDAESIARVMQRVQPDLVVNAAAYTAVDRAETERDLALATNSRAPGCLAGEAARHGAAIVHFSSDYVFDGEKAGAYEETDEPAPLSWYGETKLAGERAVERSEAPHLIFRLSWVYSLRGPSFLRTMLRLFAERDVVRVVDDQHGSPTWSCAIAGGVVAAVEQATRHPEDVAKGVRTVQGIYHVSATGRTTWHGFATRILEHARSSPGVGHDLAVRIDPIPSERYPLSAARPRNSVLSNRRFRDTFGLSLPNWETQLEECLSELSEAAAAVA